MNKPSKKTMIQNRLSYKKRLKTLNLNFYACLFALIAVGLTLRTLTQDVDLEQLFLQLGTSVLTGLSVGFVFDFFVRQSFIDLQNETFREQMKTGNQALLTSLESNFDSIKDQLSLLTEEKSVGLKTVQGNAHNYDYSELLLNSKCLTIVLNDGHSWLSGNRKSLQKRLHDSDKRTDIYFLDPGNTEAWTILARKEDAHNIGEYVESKRNQLSRDIEKIMQYASSDTNLSIYGHPFINPYSLYLADDSAIITPYMHTGRPCMLLEFIALDFGNVEDCYYSQLNEDVGNLKQRSRQIWSSYSTRTASVGAVV